jgi:hypothetical protein
MKSVPFCSQIVNWDNEDSGFPTQEAVREWEQNPATVPRGIWLRYGRPRGRRTRHTRTGPVDNGHGVTGLVCNHPSSGVPWNKPAWHVELDTWERSFSGNYMEFFPGQGEPTA